MCVYMYIHVTSYSEYNDTLSHGDGPRDPQTKNWSPLELKSPLGVSNHDHRYVTKYIKLSIYVITYRM